MKRKICFQFATVTFLWLFVGGAYFECFAQGGNELFKKLPEELGLNNTTVTSIVQDQQGYIWFGTWVGLYRYDGHESKLYKIQPNQKNSLQSNKISALMIAKNGDLYIGTMIGGVHKYRYEYDDFIALNDDGKNVLRSNIWALYEDKYHQIWAGTEKGLSILDEQSQSFKNKDIFLKSEINTKRIQQITDCNTDYIWVASDDGVFCFLPEKNGTITELGHYSFYFEDFKGEQSSFVSSIINDPTNEDKILALCKNGIIELNYAKGLSKATYKILYPANGRFSFPRTIYASKLFSENFLIGANSGLSLLSKDGKIIYNKFLEGNIVRCLYEDSFGTLWVGTEYGLRKYNKSESYITTRTLSEEDIQLDVIQYISKSPLTGDIWMAWQNGTISRMKYGHHEELKYYQLYNAGQLVGERISQLAVDEKGRVWVGTQGAGLLKFYENQAKNNQRINVEKELTSFNGLGDNYLMSVTNVGDHLWLGTWNKGFYRYVKDSKQLTHFETIQGLDFRLNEVPVVEIAEMPKAKKLILGTRGSGIVVADFDRTQISNPYHFISNSKTNAISNDFITDIFVDAENVLVCSEGGLDQYLLSENKINSLLLDDQLPKSIIQAAIVSEDNHYWVSTYNNGLLEIDKTGKKWRYKNYTKNVLANYAGSAALLIGKDCILFGGAQGFSMLTSADKDVNTIPPIPFILDLKINNKSVSLGEAVNGSEKFDKVIAALPKVNLNYKDNAFSLAINAIQTADAQSLKYAYMLEGFHDNWIYASENEKNISFTNLPYKTYHFKFKAANSDGVWSKEAVLPITVSPPWWQSNIAYMLYLLTIITIVYLVIQAFVMKEQYDHQIKLEKIERAKIEEINQMKLKFYTSISHELRTPLTMIISPLEQLLSEKEKVDVKQSHHFMLKNAKKLLAMVNQLLDFRKHESGIQDLQLKRQDLIPFVKDTLNSFHSLAKDKEIHLVFSAQCEHLHMAFDDDQMDKLINNLVGNALKYTPRLGTVGVHIKEDSLLKKAIIEVKDSGVGIDKEDIDKIFERFYQGKDHAHSGYGLGLSIVKSIVDLHKGQIVAESQKGVGTTFKIELPMTLEENFSENHHHHRHDLEYKELFVEEVELPIQKAHEDEVTEDRKLLIVEDNEEIRSYLKQNFSAHFEILEAKDGLRGLELATSEIPDLIISDIAMPGMDGLELCREIKSKIATSHIPVILLTARTSVENKLAGYEFGANAYVTKPFNMELLKQRVSNLLEYSDILKEKYGKPASKGHYVYEPEQPEEQSLNDEFMKNLTNIIEENMSEAGFTVDDMAKLLLMSRIQVYRKVKALTGQTPNNFLREIRLKRAAQFLELTDYSISEITYKVGFNDLKYFREKFKEEFGINPSDYRVSNKTAQNN